MSPASMLSTKGFATVVDLNLNGTFNMCKAAFDGYMGEHGGSIVNIVAECRNGFPRMVHTVRFISMTLWPFCSSLGPMDEVTKRTIVTFDITRVPPDQALSI